MRGNTVSVLSSVAVLLLVACQTVPITGRSQLQLLGEGTEIQMGLSAYRDTLKKEKISGDVRLNDQVTRVGVGGCAGRRMGTDACPVAV